jgi:ribosomal 50S subunit-recycling heat shock protein
MLLAENVTDASRTHGKKMIKNGYSTVDNHKTKAGAFVCSGQMISILINKILLH